VPSANTLVRWVNEKRLRLHSAGSTLPHLWPSSPRDFHPEALTDPCMTVSGHTARAIQQELPPSATTIRFLLLPVDQHDHDANGLLPSLHGHYPASRLLRSSPPLACASVLSASRFFRLCLFPFHRKARFSSSVQKPGLDSRHLYTGHRMVSKQVSSMLFPDQSAALVSMSCLNFRRVINGSLTLVSPIHT